MRYNVDGDAGSVIHLWVTRDNPSETPSLALHAGGQHVATLEANTIRGDLRDHGLHTTGLCGFTLDEDRVPGIAEMFDLELREAESGIPIYARFRPDSQRREKVLIWSRPSLMQLDSWADPAQFGVVYPDLDALSLETSGALLDHARSVSILAIGRPNLLRFGDLLDRQDFEVLFVLTDPYIDLAERLYAMRAEAAGEDDAQRPEQRLGAVLRKTNLEDHRSLVRFFRTLERNETSVFRSPLTRALTKAPEEDVRRQDVPVALKVLSKHRVACTDQTLHLFTGGAPGRSATAPEVLRLADRLRQIESVSDLLNEDIALYRYVGLAVGAAHDADDTAGGATP